MSETLTAARPPISARLSSAAKLIAGALFVLLLIELTIRAGDGLIALLAATKLADGSGLIPAFIGIAAINCMFMAFEGYEDRSKLTARRFMASFGRGIFFTLIVYSLVVPLRGFIELLSEYGWLPAPLVRPEDLLPIALLYPLIFWTIQDFFYYWLHRAMHVSPVLWRFHAVHHSLEELTSWNGYNHWGEEYLRQALVLVPTILIMQPPPEKVFILSAAIFAWGSYIHSSARCLSLPASLRPYLADNVYHHYHHALDPAYHGKNFAAFYPLWDRLFGTQHIPATSELPKVGLDGIASPRTVGEFVLRPFRSKG